MNSEAKQVAKPRAFLCGTRRVGTVKMLGYWWVECATCGKCLEPDRSRKRAIDLAVKYSADACPVCGAS